MEEKPYITIPCKFLIPPPPTRDPDKKSKIKGYCSGEITPFFQ